MKITKALLLPALIGVMTLTMYSCKTKKMATKPAPAPVAKQAPPAEEKPAPPPPAPVAPVEKPDYNFSNVLFEFNSSVLKTASFQILEQAVVEMKKDASVKYIINGHSSSEGSADHNMSLSIDRANSVKSFLVNAGIDAANFSIKGFGQRAPASSNDTEEGKSLNRRVEIKVN
ncbi:outer membrane protein OmpA-like peptidoglycan-associated protein [Pedobacter sp. CG_S7]|uniref:OmpA family protein n=1 Tax=Pedobacter sp. CG_S7 TaxID=3143930 RepID=UPI00339459AC